MLYNPKNQVDIQRAIEKIKYFIAKGYVFELRKKQEPKSLNQNKYFHLIVSWFALEYGETARYVKDEIVKKIVCREVFLTEYANHKTGEIREEYRSFSELTKEETSLVINKFRDYSSKEAGIYLPEPKDLVFLEEIEIQIKNNSQFL